MGAASCKFIRPGGRILMRWLEFIVNMELPGGALRPMFTGLHSFRTNEKQARLALYLTIVIGIPP